MALPAVQSNTTETTPAPTQEAGAPITLDLGKQRRKAVRRLRRGSGKLMDEVMGAIEELRAAGAISAHAQPVIVVVQQKRRRRQGWMPGL